MKRLTFSFLVFLFISCNNKDNASTVHSDSTVTTASTANYDYPYTLEKPYSDWQAGDQQHAVNILKSLKAFENNDIPEAIKYFADSVELHMDNLDTKVSRDSLATMFRSMRESYSSMVVKMQDWEPVISKDKKDQWVTLWYKQIITDKSGKIDSVDVINDAKFIGGKIAVLNEATRHYGKK